MSWTTSYYVGLSVGLGRDYTALAVVEQPLWVANDAVQFRMHTPHTGWVSPADLVPAQVRRLQAHNYWQGRPAQPPLSVRHLERFALGTKYPAMVGRVASLLTAPPLAESSLLVVDGTDAGAPVVDGFRLATGGLVEVTVTGGAAMGYSDDYRYTVPKRDLAGTLQALLHGDRLKIAAGLPDAATLADELLNFRLTASEKAHDTYEGRAGVHDDLVLAVAVACWFRGWFNTRMDRHYARGEARAVQVARAMESVQ